MELRNKDCTNKNTLNDPCPTGWRVISRDELGTLVDNTTHSYTGNAATSSIGSAAAVLTSKFNTSVKVTLPLPDSEMVPMDGFHMLVVLH